MTPNHSRSRTALAFATGVCAGALRRVATHVHLPHDFGLSLTGLSLAGTSLTFATLMIVQREDAPHVPGSEYLTIFRSLGPAMPAERGLVVARRADISLVDPTPTGRIDGIARSESVRASGALRGFALRRVQGGQATIDGPSGLFDVVPGFEIPGAGTVMSIERRDVGWVVVTSLGEIAGAR